MAHCPNLKLRICYQFSEHTVEMDSITPTQMATLAVILVFVGALFALNFTLKATLANEWIGRMNGNYAKMFFILLLAFLVYFAFSYKSKKTEGYCGSC